MKFLKGNSDGCEVTSQSCYGYLRQMRTIATSAMLSASCDGYYGALEC